MKTGKPIKVLIVDDSSETRAMIRLILEGKGHTVVGEAGDAAGAVRAFAELRPDVVLLDIIMPGKSGVEALADIRKIDPEARVIMVTAVEQDTINRRLLLIGADGIIYKPFTSGEFDQSFHNFLKHRPPKGRASDTIQALAAGGLSKCMLRTSDASSWAWELCGVEVFPGKAGDLPGLMDFGADAAAVQVNIRNGASFAASMVFRAEDLGFISQCFVKGPLYQADEARNMEEGLMMEIGNIILNALAGPLLNALKKLALPSVPMLIKGGPGAVAAGLTACMPPGRPFRVISASLAMRRDGRLARAGVLAVLPEELAAALERE